MTLKQLYEYALVEMNKSLASSILLEDFNLFSNKAVNQYNNKKYNLYDTNQQATDDLGMLQASADLTPSTNNIVNFPMDYWHLLNCSCTFEVIESDRCNKKGDTVTYVATKLTSDIAKLVEQNAYFKPSYKRPYYYINKTNISQELPTNPFREGAGSDVTYKKDNGQEIGVNLLPTTIKIGGKKRDNINREAGFRYGNVVPVRCEIRFGNSKKYKLTKVSIDYLKTPLYLKLTQKQLDTIEDKSLMLEYPDYVCFEILNELTNLLMENNSDPRLQTHIPITMSIANPAQALAQTAQ